MLHHICKHSQLLGFSFIRYSWHWIGDVLHHLHILNYFGTWLSFTTDPESGMCYIIGVKSPDYLGMRFIQYSWPLIGDVLHHDHILNYFWTRLSFITDPELKMCYIIHVISPIIWVLGSSSTPDPEMGMCYIMSISSIIFLARLRFTTDPESEMCYISFVNSSSNSTDPELGMCYIMSIS